MKTAHITATLFVSLNVLMCILLGWAKKDSRNVATRMRGRDAVVLAKSPSSKAVVVLELPDYGNTRVVAARVEESDVLRLKDAANGNVMAALVPPKVLVNADSVTVEVSGVTEKARGLRYDRVLETGFGDRISVYMSIAAIAATVNESVYVWWHECLDRSEHHAELCLHEINMHVKWPANLHVLSKKDFDKETASLPEITYNAGGLLPSNQAFDGVYTTAWKTMRLPGMLTQPHKRSFEKSYRQVCKELRFRNVEGNGVPEIGYTVLHVRGGDKRKGLHEFNTVSVLQQLPPGTILVVVTDEPKYCAEILREYHLRQHNASLQIVQLSVVETNNSKSIAKQNKLLHDFTVLLGADAIIQHSPYAWSAFSNTASMIRQVPLLSTWKSNAATPSTQKYIGLLAVLQQEEDCPPEFFSSNRPSEVARFMEMTFVKTHKARAGAA